MTYKNLTQLNHSPETMQPLESDKLSDFMSTGFVALRYTLQCEDNYQGVSSEMFYKLKNV